MPGQKQLWTSIFADLARTCHASLTMDGVAVPADRVAQATTDRVLRSACEAPPVIGTTRRGTLERSQADHLTWRRRRIAFVLR